jgi:hypothetical protein
MNNNRSIELIVFFGSIAFWVVILILNAYGLIEL